MAADRHQAERENNRRPSTPTTPPPSTPTEDDDRIVFASWDAPLVPDSSNR